MSPQGRNGKAKTMFIDFGRDEHERDSYGANYDRIRETFGGDMDPDRWEHIDQEALFVTRAKREGTFVGTETDSGIFGIRAWGTVIAGESCNWYPKPGPDADECPF